MVASRQALGDSVRALVLPGDPGLEGLKEAGVEVIVGSLIDKEAVEQAVAGVDIIVHLAAAMLWEQGADRELFQQNIAGTFNLFDAVVSQKVTLQRFFIASSDEVYPSLKALYSPIDERHPQQPYSFYGLTKEIDERLALYYHRSHGVPVTIARFALIARSEEIRRPSGWSGRFLFVEPMRNLFTALGRPDAVAALDAAKTGTRRHAASGARRGWHSVRVPLLRRHRPDRRHQPDAERRLSCRRDLQSERPQPVLLQSRGRSPAQNLRLPLCRGPHSGTRHPRQPRDRQGEIDPRLPSDLRHPEDHRRSGQGLILFQLAGRRQAIGPTMILIETMP
jgi:hypothetical protein